MFSTDPHWWLGHCVLVCISSYKRVQDTIPKHLNQCKWVQDGKGRSVEPVDCWVGLIEWEKEDKKKNFRAIHAGDDSPMLNSKWRSFANRTMIEENCKQWRKETINHVVSFYSFHCVTRGKDMKDMKSVLVYCLKHEALFFKRRRANDQDLHR